ncbi:MAG: hypothetical protein IPM56_05500 [Ignavibacteriales bacterium]|nr:MAG: hypothetical protein IPM56_05500 [Ignavibacteriales bacterium]
MELIPILSTIILVATISTFLLAIGAYVLYKIRERRGEQFQTVPPSQVKAELVTPDDANLPQSIYVEQPAYSEGSQMHQPLFLNFEADREQKRSPKSVQFDETGFETVKPRRSTSYSRSSQNKNTETKFLKYTSEGYVSTKEDKVTGAMKWR